MAARVDDRYAAEIQHPLATADGVAVAAMRVTVAPLKGTMSGPEARAPFDQMMENVPDAVGVGYTNGVVGGVHGTWCHPQDFRPDAAIVYLHGGAYVLGSAYSYRHFAGQIAARAGVATFVVEYRLAPENAFPAALNDALAAYNGLVAQGARRIGLVGDSAGGGLAVSLLAAARDAAIHSGGIAASVAVAMSPWTDLALTVASFEDRAQDDPLVTKAMLATAATSFLAGHDPRDPLASPLYSDLRGLPPVQLHVGTSEALLDDARRYAEQFCEAGGEAVVHSWEGMTHAFPTSVGTFEASDAALDILGTFLAEKLRFYDMAAK